jgi:hypothetical protein
MLIILITLGGCATRYMVPTNRFITPESQGGVLRGQFELQYTQAHELSMASFWGRTDDGVLYNEVSRTGYMLSTSLFNAFDFIWSHTASSNSMVGGKVQFVGGSRTEKAAGHKLALAALVGANDHVLIDESVSFRLEGKEVLLIYGYRINEIVMPYMSLAKSDYNFDATLKSPWPTINGQTPSFKTSIISANLGTDLSIDAFFGKIELSYQQVDTNNTKELTALNFGVSAGVNW